MKDVNDIKDLIKIMKSVESEAHNYIKGKLLPSFASLREQPNQALPRDLTAHGREGKRREY